jgi:hypothetical protein
MPERTPASGEKLLSLISAAKLNLKLPAANLKNTSDISSAVLGISTWASHVNSRLRHVCLIAVSVTSRKLHQLASLPTGTPESAGLCALGLGFIVCRSLENFSDRVW